VAFFSGNIFDNEADEAAGGCKEGNDFLAVFVVYTT